MPGKHLFEYAVIRVVPRVEREEFLNVGVILYCKSLKFLEARMHIHKERLALCCSDTDIAELSGYLGAMQRICAGHEEAGPIALLDQPSRFRWLTAARSTVIQTSKVHPGYCDTAEEQLQRLFEKLVL